MAWLVAALCQAAPAQQFVTPQQPVINGQQQIVAGPGGATGQAVLVQPQFDGFSNRQSTNQTPTMFQSAMGQVFASPQVAYPPPPGSGFALLGYRSNPVNQAYLRFMMLARDLDSLNYANSVAVANTGIVSNFDSGLTPGFETGYRREIFSNWEAEGRYFDVRNMQTRTPESAVFTAAPIGSTEVYSSTIRNAEINVYTPNLVQSNALVKALAGFRYIQYDEQLSSVGAPGAARMVSTDNNLYGGQLGLEISTNADPGPGQITLSGVIKTGVFYGDTQADIPHIFGPALRGVENAPVFAAETAIRASYQLFEWLSVDVSYELIYIAGVALAGEQLFINPPFPDHGDVLLNGFTVGGTGRW